MSCDVNTDDVMRGLKIYGTPVPLLKGKMKRVAPIQHPKDTSIPLDFIISKERRDIILYVDLFYVNKIPFYVSKSGKINHIGVQKLNSRKASKITNFIIKEMEKYTARGFVVTDIHADNEFDIASLKRELQPTAMHFYAKGEHVGVIENTMKTIKERGRCTCHATPYRQLPS